ncbi:iron chelate uptake ABC transporter family permease subunit [Corynebacterium kroppenstedtii]|uniref:ABC-type transport system, permease protein n=2 Tax=Corynebacterium kroppenstedtii TaxID=161879 RepID=C4LH89_CORK4|nr:iron chelate uptake ABC transporter family permease subunit [Corynebacterium kroppenstedtii]ACR17194.1 ABC-type transport system, permease protein [Corynebacterium kroppenstedtii DSM 44385]QRP11298.1 iron chelate uptake ABC transporter family permease subunit [Corynebacterium kroppenstedtii]HJD69073.1 iron ABC transporter permease [Corynebacterium kroppenstedtii]
MTSTVKLWILVSASLVALFVSILFSITLGPLSVSMTDAWRVVAFKLGLSSTPEGVTLLEQNAIWELRMPRALLAAVAGAALSICGAVLQSLLRNGLADPYLLGISSGASAGAVVVVLTASTAASFVMAPGAFAGALAAFSLVLLLAWAAGNGNHNIILAGVAITQLFSALTSFLIMFSADANTTRGVLFWMLGSLASSSWQTVALSTAIFAVSFVVLFCHSTALDAFTFGADSAASLGINVKRVRMVVIGVASLLAATIVSSSGAIGFVGLVLPHAARLIVGTGHRRVLPVSAALGAILLVWVDALGRTVAAPVEIPVGVITALVGVPLFIALLVKQGRGSRTHV